MAARRKKKEEEVDVSPTGFMKASLESAQKEFGRRGTYVAAEHEKRQVGIPIPSLALQWLIHSRLWPLQKISLSAGPPQSCKSAFIFELHRWWLAFGGGVFHIDTESKLSADLMEGMIPPEYFDMDSSKSLFYQVVNAGSIEEWQLAMSRQLDMMDEFLFKAGRKLEIPIMISVDSMTGVGGDEAAEKIRATGSGIGRAFSMDALVITQYMKTISDRILGWPATVHLSNHMKKAHGGMGYNTPGGVSKDFHASIDLRFQRGGGEGGFKSGMRPIKQGNVQGWNVDITSYKNSFGPTIDRKIVAPFVWWFDTVEGKDGPRKKQFFNWDWDSADAMMLAQNATKLKGVLTVKSRKVDHVGYLYSCPELGFEGDKPASMVKPAEIGQALREKPELVSLVQEALNLPRANVFAPGMLDYEDDLAIAAAEKKKRSKKGGSDE